MPLRGQQSLPLLFAFGLICALLAGGAMAQDIFGLCTPGGKTALAVAPETDRFAPGMRAEAERRLREAGIYDPDAPDFLSIPVTVAEAEDGGEFALSCTAAFYKQLADEGITARGRARTWERGALRLAEAEDEIVRTAMDLVDIFIFEFIRANASGACVAARNNAGRQPAVFEGSPDCEWLKRPERYFHAPGRKPEQVMSVAASISAGASAMGWTWSHALPGALLYMELDFGALRRPLSAAEWFCLVDEKTGGALRLQMYPATKHLFVGEVQEQQGNTESDRWADSL